MGARGLIVLALAACGHPATPRQPASLPERVAADFAAAVAQSKDAYVALFDFAAVGELEILLHRYDLNGRLVHLEDDQKQQFIDEDGTPYPAERERPVGEVTDAVRTHGLMTPGEERVIFSTCVREVLVPGFTALGIAVGTAVDDYGDAWARAA